MYVIHSKPESLSNNKMNSEKTSLRNFRGGSVAALVEVGVVLAAAQSKPLLPGQCSNCCGFRNPRYSTAQFSNVFCSKECEQEFVRAAIGSLTGEECIRIHQRLEALITNAEEAAL
jgi:hypothetical protein